MVDDLKENLEVPRELGADAHHFKDNECLWRHLISAPFDLAIYDFNYSKRLLACVGS